jgi:hypothetical protein
MKTTIALSGIVVILLAAAAMPPAGNSLAAALPHAVSRYEPAAPQRIISKRQPAVRPQIPLKSTPLQLPGYTVWSEESSREEEHEFRTDGGDIKRIGLLRRTEFNAADEAALLSPEELIQRYTNEMKDAGAEVLYRSGERATFRMLTGDLESWIEVKSTDDGYVVTVVDDIPASTPLDIEWQVAPAGSLAEISVPHLTLHPGSDLSIADIQALRPPMVTYYVSAGAGEDGDGSEANPFGTINQALEHADALDAMKVRVMLGYGVYEEDIAATRATDIIGDETIPKIRGRIDGAGRNLKLENIEIREAPDWGVRQAGGVLEMTNCRIVETRRSGNDPASGRGVTLSGGATAVFISCVFRSNEGQALLLTGEGTIATCSDLQAAYNRVHPAAADLAAESNDISGTGCIEVTNGAKLQMEEFDLVGNEFIGVLLRDGSSAHLRYGRIDGTESIENRGGLNLSLLHDSRIELQHIVTSNGMCGLFMFHSWLRVIDIELISNSIGIACQEPPDGYDLGACLYAFEGNIRMENNGINFDSPGAMTVPDHSDILGDDGSDGAEPDCPEVPWE